MAHTIRDRKPLLTRVRRIQGQLRSLETTLDEGGDCAAVLQQIAAVRGAVAGLMNQVLEGHIREHLGNPEASPAEREEDVAEVLTALRSYLR
ncbi:metal/formaldehyde-sensitive transcriptional repressor [Uliginosibacterium sp. 31-16]|uniref:metal/formaldehyde-sensitive transcriptional repressor n=1 Tax=Uliginosibacterium sp. 31-16 TaxID=3068315 RepID=UPI00273FE215|nr:metal/formaldehyde-sensitive transcriptional repressor [Uliginosibacterium sp. 31-16]MDP5238866.1 metal/formaldehyde-sensitive transcriptional repressor [Uliginosibacterium sp. 31-16]